MSSPRRWAKYASMRLSALVLVILATFAAVLLAACEEPVSAHRSSIVDGQATVGLHTFQEDSVVSVKAGILSCSGTLVAPRLVLTAVHCVAANYVSWNEGAALERMEPTDLRIGVGPNANDPRCELRVAEIHTHPLVTPDPMGGVIHYDLAALVLSESALEECANLIPIQIGTEAQIAGSDPLIVSGFGYRDPEGSEIGERRWGRVEVERVTPISLIVRDVGEGFPAQGDSGGPVLRRAEDGRVTLVGVTSTVVVGLASIAYLRGFETFLTEEVTPRLTCPADPSAWSACEGQTAVNCDEGVFSYITCTAEETCETTGERSVCAESPLPPEADVVDAQDGGPEMTTPVPRTDNGCSVREAPDGANKTGPWVALLVLFATWWRRHI